MSNIVITPVNYIDLETFRNEARHIKSVIVQKGEVNSEIIFEQIPTVLSGNIKFGEKISEEVYSNVNGESMLVSMKILKDVIPEITRKSDERIDVVRLNDFKDLYDFRTYLAIFSVSRKTTIVKNGASRSVTQREVLIVTDKEADCDGGEDFICIDINNEISGQSL